jgi:hypothetical protein
MGPCSHFTVKSLALIRPGGLVMMLKVRADLTQPGDVSGDPRVR